MITCADCGTANRAGSKFCNECGAKLDAQGNVQSVQSEPTGVAGRPEIANGALPIWVRALDVLVSTKDAEDGDPTAVGTAEEEPPPIVAVQPVLEEMAGDTPPDWLQELPVPELDPLLETTQHHVSDPPDWLDAGEPDGEVGGLELARLEDASLQASLPDWLQEWTPDSEGALTDVQHQPTESLERSAQQVEPGRTSESEATPFHDADITPAKAGPPDENRVQEPGRDAGRATDAGSDSLELAKGDRADDLGSPDALTPEPVRNPEDAARSAAPALVAAALLEAQSGPPEQTTGAGTDELAASEDEPPESPLPAPTPVARLGPSSADPMVAPPERTPDSETPAALLFSDIVAKRIGTSDMDGGRAQTIGSILAVDSGSTVTRAFLFDVVDGLHRFVARGETPNRGGSLEGRAMQQMAQALAQVADATGRSIVDEQGQILCPERDGSGVDAMVAVQSTSRSPRLVLVRPDCEAGLGNLRRMLTNSGAQIVGEVTLRDSTSSFFEQAGLDSELEPDAFVLVDGDALRVAEFLGERPSLLPGGKRPLVIYCGSAATGSRVERTLGPDVAFQLVAVGEPAASASEDLLTRATGDLVRLWEEVGAADQDVLTAWSCAPVLSASRAMALSAEYLARRDGASVLAIDLGAAKTVLATVAQGNLNQSIRCDLGLAQNVAELLNLVPVESILRWLPFEMDPEAVVTRLQKKAQRPGSLPQTRRDLLVEQAVAREAMRLSWEDATYQGAGRMPAFDIMVGGGGVLSDAPSFGQAALMLLDGLQPIGLTRLHLDRTYLFAVAGAMAAVCPAAAAQVLEQDGLLSLGTVVAPADLTHDATMDLTVRIEYESGRNRVIRVRHGSLEVLPLPTGQTAHLEVWPTSGSSFAPEGRGRAPAAEVCGGEIGIIVDARPRPVTPGSRQQRKNWLRAIGA